MGKLNHTIHELISAFPFAVALLDEQGTIREHSPQWIKINHIPKQDVISEPLTSCFKNHQLYWEQLITASDEQKKRGWIIHSSSQKSTYLHLSLWPITLDEINYYLAYLDENEHNKAQYFELADEMLCQLDFDLKIIEANAAFKRFLTNCKTQLIDSPFLRLCTRADESIAKTAFNRLLKTHHHFNIEFRIIGRDDAEHWVDAYAHVDNKEKMIHIRLMDIDRLKAHDEKIRGAAALLDAIINLQELYITGESASTLFHTILKNIRHITQSEYAFFGLLNNNQKKSRLNVVALSHKETHKQLYELDFSYDRFEMLFTYPIKTKEAIVCNDPENDPRYKLNPPLLEEMHNFMGLPIIGKQGLVGMIGLANSTLSYQHTQAHQLDLLLKIVASIIEAQDSASTLEKLAHFDHVTGLFNRARFECELKEKVELAKTTHKKLGLLYIDLDKFKNINDTLGHKVGDQVLKHASKRLKNTVRDTDFIARLGGDEFAIILDDIHCHENLETVAEKIARRIKEPFKINDKELKINASIGISIYPESGETPEKLLSHADFALYRAKNQTFTRYCLYTRRLHQLHYRRIEIEDHLEHALAHDEFFMMYQPQVDLINNQFKGFEALIRWEHPSLGRVSPAEFIKIAEETGKIDDLNLWVIKRTLQDYREITRQCEQNYQLSINISPRISNIRAHFQDLEDLLAKHEDLLPHIDIEITENALIDKLGEFEKILHELNKKLKLQITIDDFGIAFSSMNRLRSLPVKALKIDMSFIREICLDHKTAMIVKSIIDLGKNLNIEVIAEGAEREEQIEKLRSLDCPVVQGFYYHPPLNIDKLCSVLSENIGL